MTKPNITHPDPIDVHVGQRVRMRRKALGLNQEQLGVALRISFQQLQKYESGRNRISASRLHSIATELEVPIDFFFEELSSPETSTCQDIQSLELKLFMQLSTEEGIALNTGFERLPDDNTRRKIVALVEAIADGIT